MVKLGFALCASFCTFEKAILKIDELKDKYDILPIMSENAYNTDTRFGKAEDIIFEIEDICQKRIIHSIDKAEPLGPKKMIDILIVAPCTGNTIGKIANGITDTSVTMAIKSCLRIGIPIVLCISTNDALGASFPNIGKLLNSKNIYIVPLSQDDPINKPNSLVAEFDKIEDTIKCALEHKQIQPIFVS